MSGWGVAIGVAVLAGGTYLLRVAGPMLRTRVEMSQATSALLDRAAVVLLVGVALTGAMFDGAELVGWARPAGVAAGVIAALCKAPLVLVVIVAAGITAGLRAVGVA